MGDLSGTVARKNGHSSPERDRRAAAADGEVRIATIDRDGMVAIGRDAKRRAGWRSAGGGLYMMPESSALSPGNPTA
jgi:hypothetical protein